MARKPSAETELRTVKRLLAERTKELAFVTNNREHYRIRATKAEQEVAEWKRRFDELLRLKPSPPPQRESK